MIIRTESRVAKFEYRHSSYSEITKVIVVTLEKENVISIARANVHLDQLHEFFDVLVDNEGLVKMGNHH